jgi:hypothetical protein
MNIEEIDFYELCLKEGDHFYKDGLFLLDN